VLEARLGELSGAAPAHAAALLPGSALPATPPTLGFRTTPMPRAGWLDLEWRWPGRGEDSLEIAKLGIFGRIMKLVARCFRIVWILGCELMYALQILGCGLSYALLK